MTYSHQNATLTAGTLVYYKALNAADETYALWNGLTEIGDIGTSGSFVEDTTLADTVKTYIPGMKDTSELEFTFYRYNADTAQADLISKAQAGTSVTIKIVWPNNTQAVFDAALNGYAVVGAGNEDGVKGKINLRVSGDTTFSTVAATQQGQQGQQGDTQQGQQGSGDTQQGDTQQGNNESQTSNP